jgi:hypothetical protein
VGKALMRQEWKLNVDDAWVDGASCIHLKIIILHGLSFSPVDIFADI